MHVSDETAKNPSIHRHVKLGTKDHLFLTALCFCFFYSMLFCPNGKKEKERKKECFLILTGTFNSLKVLKNTRCLKKGFGFCYTRSLKNILFQPAKTVQMMSVQNSDAI